MKIKLSDLFTMVKSCITGSGYIFMTVILERALFFFLFVFLARKLPTGDYGQIIYIFSTANILASFFEFGLPVYFQRESAVGSAELKTEVNSAIIFKLFSFLLYILVFLLYLMSNPSVPVSSAIIIGTTIFLFSINVMLNALLYGRHLYRTSFYAIIPGRMILITFLLVYWFTNLTAEFVLSGFFISGLIHFIILRYILSVNDIRFSSEFGFSALKRILKSSFIIYVGYICIWLYDKLDILFLGNYHSYDAVAIYAAAYSIYKLPQILAGIILVPLFSGLSKDYSENQKLNKNKLIEVFTALVIVSLIICVIISSFSDGIVNIIYGEKYLEAGVFLRYLLIAVPGLILNNFTGIISNTIRKEKYSLSGTIAGTLLNILACLILIPLWGINGAVTATIITEYSVFGVQAFLIAKFNYKKIIFV